MNIELQKALDDADKWYELYLGQKFANEQLVKLINEYKAELLKLHQAYDLTAEMLEEEQQKELAYG